MNKYLSLRDLQPSQFYISSKKIKEIEKWFKEDLSNFDPIPVRLLDNKLVMTDGHTRAVVAIMHGIDKVKVIEDKDDLSWDMYRECVKECINQSINSPYDLVNRIVDEKTYREKWDKWCDDMQKDVINKRNNKVAN